MTPEKSDLRTGKDAQISSSLRLPFAIAPLWRAAEAGLGPTSRVLQHLETRLDPRTVARLEKAVLEGLENATKPKEFLAGARILIAISDSLPPGKEFVEERIHLLSQAETAMENLYRSRSRTSACCYSQIYERLALLWFEAKDWTRCLSATKLFRSYACELRSKSAYRFLIPPYLCDSEPSKREIEVGIIGMRAACKTRNDDEIAWAYDRLNHLYKNIQTRTPIEMRIIAALNLFEGARLRENYKAAQIKMDDANYIVNRMPERSADQMRVKMRLLLRIASVHATLGAAGDDGAVDFDRGKVLGNAAIREVLLMKVKGDRKFGAGTFDDQLQRELALVRSIFNRRRS